MLKNVAVNIKDSTVETPQHLSEYLYKSVNRKPFHNILDIGCFRGSLSKSFKKKKKTKIVGLDIDDTYSSNFEEFIHEDFLETTIKDYKVKPDLILTNPPFGRDRERNALTPQLWLEHIFEIFGVKQPVIMIVGAWYLSNSAKRMKYLNQLLDEKRLTKQITLHKNVFKPNNVESAVLYFNINQRKSFEYFTEKPIPKKQKFKTVAFSHEQVEWVNKNIDNFSSEIKEFLKEKYSDFPQSKRG